MMSSSAASAAAAAAAASPALTHTLSHTHMGHTRGAGGDDMYPGDERDDGDRYDDSMDESGSEDAHTHGEGRSPMGRMRSASRASGISTADDAAKNFKVVIRVRPPLPRELTGDSGRPFENVVKVDASERVIVISENLAALEDGATGVGPYSTHVFTFDHVYDQHCDQKKVYETTAKGVVESSLKGYNATIFATGTGKTYTMEGFNSAEERGIIPRAIEQIFRHIQSSVSPRMRFLVRASYLQIYNEVISDLLKPERSNLLIREDKKKGVYVEGLSEWVVRSPAEIYGLMERGGATRATASTKMNEISSRSHAVFIVIVEQSETTYLDEGGNEMSVEEFHRLVKSRAHGDSGLKQLEANVRQSFKVGKLNLVDLAGSERVRYTGATGQRLEESKKINQSLSALGNVIAALTEARQHIPYRDSKLTRILEDSLGGNCKTTMMAMISPALEAFAESLSTLKFANRAKHIKNEARVNEDLDQKSLLRRYERELKRLRTELEERSRSVVDSRRLLELDEQRRRAEEDKMAAIRALEARSREFMREKQEKKRLEERIQLLQGQIMMGGAMAVGNVMDTPAFRNALKEHQERIRLEYESRLAELEKERETIEEEKAQVDRYKQLLLKQRDIMILLTQRLNERDEQIMALQDELDAYDRHQRELEEKLDEKTAALIHLQRVTMEHNAASPVKNSDLVEALGDWAGAGQLQARMAAAGITNTRVAAHADGTLSGVPPAMLVTTKQYRPFDESARDSAAAAAAAAMEAITSPSDDHAGSHSPDSASGSTGVLLSAEEKITELSKLLDAFRMERDRLGRDLEDVQAEKVSMEYLLREKLEKLVQSEIETRLAAYRKDGGSGPGATPTQMDSNLSMALPPSAGMAVRHLQNELQSKADELVAAQTELSRAQDEIRRLRVEASQSSAKSIADHSGSPADAPARALQDRLAVHEKERKAIQTIMEHKIKKLVDAISTAAASGGAAASGARLMSEISTLQRLVNASVSAMKNSELDASKSDAASSSSSVSNASVPAASALSTPAPSSRSSSAHAPTVLTSASHSTINASFAASAAPSPAVMSARSGGLGAMSVDQLIQQRKEELQRSRVGGGGISAASTPVAPAGHRM